MFPGVKETGKHLKASATSPESVLHQIVPMIEHPRKPDVPRPPDSPDIIDGEPSDLNPAPPPDIPPQPLPDRPDPHPDTPGLR